MHGHGSAQILSSRKTRIKTRLGKFVLRLVLAQILSSRKTRIKTNSRPPTNSELSSQILSSRKTRIKTLEVSPSSAAKDGTQILSSRKTRIKTTRHLSARLCSPYLRYYPPEKQGLRQFLPLWRLFATRPQILSSRKTRIKTVSLFSTPQIY